MWMSLVAALLSAAVGVYSLLFYDYLEAQHERLGLPVLACTIFGNGAMAAATLSIGTYNSLYTHPNPSDPNRLVMGKLSGVREQPRHQRPADQRLVFPSVPLIAVWVWTAAGDLFLWVLLDDDGMISAILSAASLVASAAWIITSMLHEILMATSVIPRRYERVGRQRASASARDYAPAGHSSSSSSRRTLEEQPSPFGGPDDDGPGGGPGGGGGLPSWDDQLDEYPPQRETVPIHVGSRPRPAQEDDTRRLLPVGQAAGSPPGPMATNLSDEEADEGVAHAPAPAKKRGEDPFNWGDEEEDFDGSDGPGKQHVEADDDDRHEAYSPFPPSRPAQVDAYTRDQRGRRDDPREEEDESAERGHAFGGNEPDGDLDEFGAFRGGQPRSTPFHEEDNDESPDPFSRHNVHQLAPRPTSTRPTASRDPVADHSDDDADIDGLRDPGESDEVQEEVPLRKPALAPTPRTRHLSLVQTSPPAAAPESSGEEGPHLSKEERRERERASLGMTPDEYRAWRQARKAEKKARGGKEVKTDKEGGNGGRKGGKYDGLVVAAQPARYRSRGSSRS